MKLFDDISVSSKLWGLPLALVVEMSVRRAEAMSTFRLVSSAGPAREQ